MRLAYPLNAFPHQAKTITQPGRFVKKATNDELKY